VSSLDSEAIAKLLQEDANKPKRGGGPRVDPTEDRTLQTWYKLNHHFCLSHCHHREEKAESGIETTRACWNPNCVDPRDPGDKGTQVVVQIKNQQVCRYCFLEGFLR
jgi:hypothetical protein